MYTNNNKFKTHKEKFVEKKAEIKFGDFSTPFSVIEEE